MERVMDGPRNSVGGQTSEHRGQEVSERLLIHLPAGHGKLAVADGALATDVSIDGDVVGRVSDDQLGFVAGQQLLINGFVASISAVEAMIAQDPDVAKASDDTVGE